MAETNRREEAVERIAQHDAINRFNTRFTLSETIGGEAPWRVSTDPVGILRHLGKQLPSFSGAVTAPKGGRGQRVYDSIRTASARRATTRPALPGGSPKTEGPDVVSGPSRGGAWPKDPFELPFFCGNRSPAD